MEPIHAADRLATKNPQEAIITEIQRDFNLTRIFARAHFEQMERYFREHTALDLTHGQIAYEAVAAEEPAGKPLRDCRRIMLRLTLVEPEELEILRSRGLAAVRQARLLRMANEAHTQGALLTVEDLAFLTTCSVATVKRDLAALRQAEVMVPTRGNVKDIGPGVSHKTQIVQLYLRGYQFTEIQQRTRHSAGSVKRYLRDFSHVIDLHLQGLPLEEMRMVTGCSERLIGEYIGLYKATLRDYPHAPRLQRFLETSSPPQARKRGQS